MVTDKLKNTLAGKMLVEGCREGWRSGKCGVLRTVGALAILAVAGIVETAITGTPAMTVAYGKQMIHV